MPVISPIAATTPTASTRAIARVSAIRRRSTLRESGSAIGRSALDRLEQALCDPRPAPAALDGAAGGEAEGAPFGRRERQELSQLRSEVGGVAGLEADEVREFGRVLGLDPGRDLGEPR